MVKTTTFEDAWSIRQTADGGYIVAGYAEISFPDNNDAYVIKLDSSGNEVWSETYGGPEKEGAKEIQQTADGGYVFAGFTESSGAGERDFWVVKLDNSGTVTWEETYGGSGMMKPGQFIKLRTAVTSLPVSRSHPVQGEGISGH